MRQAVYEGPRRIAVADRDDPRLGPGDVLVEVEACGVCGSDVASYVHGHYVEPGQVMGHEAVGRIVDAGPDAGHVAVGGRVAIRPLRACGVCWHCRRGETHICGRTAAGSLGYGADGAFADRVLLADDAHGRQLVALDSATPVADAVWAEPLAVALHALDRARLQAGQRALVLGAGPIGLALCAAAAAQGARAEAVEPRAARREAALAVGAAAAVDAAHAGELSEPVDVVFDASGVPDAIAAGCARLRPGGPLVLVGLGDRPLPPLPADVAVRGAFAFTADDFLRSVRLIEAGTVRLGRAVSHVFALDDTGRAIETAADDPSAVKVLVTPAPSPSNPTKEPTP